MFTAPLYPPLALILFALHTSLARVTTISNDTPRYDVAGNIVPISDGNLLQHQGVFYLYGVKCVSLTHRRRTPGQSVTFFACTSPAP
jgi:hypothetical protein